MNNLPVWIQNLLPDSDVSGSDFLEMVLTALDLFLDGIQSFAYVVLDVMTMKVSEIVPETLWGTLLEKVLDLTGLGEFPIFSLMFGVGVIVYLIWQIITWIANIWIG